MSKIKHAMEEIKELGWPMTDESLGRLVALRNSKKLIDNGTKNSIKQ